MNRPLTSGQAQVLRRLADNPDAPPPLDGWRASAVALQTRSLVTIARKGGQYLVTPTEAARYYREHDSYPPKLSVGATTSPVGEQAGSAGRPRAPGSWKASAVLARGVDSRLEEVGQQDENPCQSRSSHHG